MARKRSILYLTNKGLQLASKSKIKNRKEYSSVTKDGESRMPVTLFFAGQAVRLVCRAGCVFRKASTRITVMDNAQAISCVCLCIGNPQFVG